MVPPRSVSQRRGWRGKPGRGHFTLEEAGTINSKPPNATGAPMAPHNPYIGGDVFLHGDGRGGAACWELMRKVGWSHRGWLISLSTGADGRLMDSLSAASHV